MNVCVFDTETIGLEKAFCYNIGLTIFDTDTKAILVAEDFVVEQIWQNKPLFETAYYANKKDIYIKRMRIGEAKLKKYGHITQHIRHLFEQYNVSLAYAYNSPFDDKVFQYNCEWFHCINPFDNVQILDIRGLVHKYIAFTNNFQKFCDKHQYYTDTGNYSTTAETLFRYITQNIAFDEEHTALADSLIEMQILLHCIELGGQYGIDYKVYRSVPRKTDRILSITDKDTELFSTTYQKAKVEKNGNGMTIMLK